MGAGARMYTRTLTRAPAPPRSRRLRGKSTASVLQHAARARRALAQVAPQSNLRHARAPLTARRSPRAAHRAPLTARRSPRAERARAAASRETNRTLCRARGEGRGACADAPCASHCAAQSPPWAHKLSGQAPPCAVSAASSVWAGQTSTVCVSEPRSARRRGWGFATGHEAAREGAGLRPPRLACGRRPDTGSSSRWTAPSAGTGARECSEPLTKRQTDEPAWAAKRNFTTPQGAARGGRPGARGAHRSGGATP